MNSATWPEVNCPDPHGPTARAHLEYILYRAQTGATSDLPRIEKALEACLRSECLTKDPPQRGKPPPDDEHGTHVLWARALASAGQWDQCAEALQHGARRTIKKTKKDLGTVRPNPE